jgi:hypothetical protein
MRAMREKRYVPPAERLKGPFDDYEVRDALSTLVNAIKIRKNKTLMRAVRAEVRKQQQAAQQVFKSTGEK